MEQIYIIDDDKANRYVCTIVLEDCGVNVNNVYSFCMVKDALNTLEHAMEIAANFHDIIFLDINLPGADGWSFLTNFRKFPEEARKHTKIFMLSSSIYPDDMERSKSFPEIVEFLSKPLSTEMVEHILVQHFAHLKLRK